MPNRFSSYSLLLIATATFLVAGLLLSGCGAEQGGRKAATEPLEKLDPYSAPMYPAQKKAQARDFTVELVSGDTFQLSEQKGKVVMLNIWATWCAPCHEETPDFVDLYNKYKSDGLVVLGVSVDKQGTSVVKPFIKKYDVNYPMVVDEGEIMDKYGPTMSIPTTYIIGRDGSLKYFAVGALTKKELEPRLQELLAESS